MERFTATPEQEEILISAFAHVAVLIGAADGKMDEEELAWSKKITQIRTFHGHDEFFDFYKKLDAQIEDRISSILEIHADNPADREEYIFGCLTEVNPVLAQLPPQYGAHLYQDLRSYAKHIARASGGFLRFFSVNANENQWLNLPMIQEVIWEEEE